MKVDFVLTADLAVITGLMIKIFKEIDDIRSLTLRVLDRISVSELSDADSTHTESPESAD